MTAPVESLETRRTKPGGPPRWLVSMSESWLELEMKKRSELESKSMASGGRWEVLVMSFGFDVEG